MNRFSILSVACLLGLAIGAADARAAETAEARLPTISVSKVKRGTITATTLVTGSFVARDEVLVSPEIDGLAVVELLSEEGDVVAANQVLARLNRDMLSVQLEQNSAQIARAVASIDNAKAQIAEAQANQVQTNASLERTKSLKESGTTTVEIYDQKLAAARVADAKLNAARQALSLAEADKVLTEKQRAELELKLSRCDIRAPTGGIVSRRTARLGQIATSVAGGEPLFRLIANGDIDLEADVPEISFSRLRVGQKVQVDVPGRDEPIDGNVRLVSPEMNPTTRLGRVRISIARGSGVALGGFGRASVVTDERNGLVVPLSAVSFGNDDATVQLVKDGVVATRQVTTGIRAGGLVEIRKGLDEGDEVVSVSGVFVRDGDKVRPVPYAAAE